MKRSMTMTLANWAQVLEQRLSTGRAPASSTSLPIPWLLFAGLPLFGLVLVWRRRGGGEL